jgi:hypothetical protein
MTEQQDLVDILNESPDSQLFAAMLTDWLIEHKDMHRSEANLHVAKVVSIAKMAMGASQGTALLAHGTISQTILRQRIQEVVNAPNPDAVVVLTVPGHQPPTLTDHSPDAAYSPAFYRTVTVGSGWLARTWIENLHLCKVRKPRVKRKK